MSYPPDTSELLQYAAIALGARYRAGSSMERIMPGADKWVPVGEQGIEIQHGKVIKPHIDNGDALWMALTLGINITMPTDQTPVASCANGDIIKNLATLPHQRAEAVRRAILLVAAELGRRALAKTQNPGAAPITRKPT